MYVSMFVSVGEHAVHVLVEVRDQPRVLGLTLHVWDRISLSLWMSR